ncbi:8-oxoguanine deaminase [Lichenicoccus roseus]|uniref:8-oxoguanine deaminase n=1 Tax=Lichenicoccus roseus TaxID=2683649 RepID=A0A5R9J8Y3_9PROT|nr:8-oxoguanine deaminase [Lichenicoccus roseus]TLU73007.1 8-oxoguanine deaminase [Lichenicoccus roseus]
MPTLLARGAEVVVTMDTGRRELRQAGLFARDGVIEQVGPDESLPATADIVLDLRHQILLPGLVNCHHHLDQTLTRNLPAGQDAALFGWLAAHYRVWARRTPEMSRTATLVGLAELALSGCTTVFDHAYLFRNGCRIDDQIAAAAEIGVRFIASRGSMSRGQSQGGTPPDECVEDEDAILADSERVIARYHDPSPGAMLQMVLAPCSPFSVTDRLMRDTAALARRHGVRLHTHLCETIDEQRYTLDRFGRRPVEYMQDLGWVDEDVWYAHAVHVDDAEIATLAAHRTGVCHCPTSNMRLASGIAPVMKYLRAGVPTGLGVDGSASNDGSNMLAETRQAMLLARLQLGLDTNVEPGAERDPASWMSARQALELATRGGAEVLGRQDIGALEVGRRCDFFTLDLQAVGYAGGLIDPVAAIVFCAPQNARTTVVEGRIVVQDGRIATLEMDAVIAEHNRHAQRLVAIG